MTMKTRSYKDISPLEHSLYPCKTEVQVGPDGVRIMAINEGSNFHDVVGRKKCWKKLEELLSPNDDLSMIRLTQLRGNALYRRVGGRQFLDLIGCDGGDVSVLIDMCVLKTTKGLSSTRLNHGVIEGVAHIISQACLSEIKSWARKQVEDIVNCSAQSEDDRTQILTICM